MKKNDIRQERSINKFTSIDDHTECNDGETFKQGFKEIYPLEILLKKENIRKRKGSFLYLFFEI